MKRIIVLFTVLLMVTITFAQSIPDYAPGQAIIRFSIQSYSALLYESPNKPAVITSNSDINSLFSEIGVWKMDRLHPLEKNTLLGENSGMNRSFVIYFPGDMAVEQTLSVLQSNPDIEYAIPNYLMVTDVTPHDQYYSIQWNLPKVNMPSAWDIQKGNTDIRIAVLDVGFKLNHEDLSSKFSQNYRRDETDIDTYLYQSCGFTLITGEDYTTPDDDPTGTGTHGTHVSGIAAAATDNDEIGVAGVGWNSKLVPVRCGFQISYYHYGNINLVESDDWIRALDWVRNNSAARVVNMSFGRPYSGGSDPDELASINAALNSGIVICASSGNDSVQSVCYPAAYPGVIAVGATNASDQRADFSNYGDLLSLVAPGVNIYSTYFDDSDNSTYEYGSGTSMAAPHVAGASSLILSQNSSLSPAEVKDILESSATKVPRMRLNNFHVEYGYGRLDVYESILNTPTEFQFVNYIQSTENYGFLVVDNDIINKKPSGAYMIFTFNTNHNVRTDELPFIANWNSTGTTQKHHRWYEDDSDYILIHQFIANEQTPAKQDAWFLSTEQAILKTELISAPSEDGGNVELRDPWRYYKDANDDWHQSNEFIPYSSPFNIGNADAQSYGGVFMNQGNPPYWDPPYYSVGAADEQDIVVNDKDIKWHFQRWEGDDVQFQHANSNQTAVVFKQPNAETRAVYKGHLCSDMTDAYSANSQRKLVRTSNGKYHTVYIENMPTDWGTYSRLWYTCSASTNFNGSWNGDIELPGTQSYPDMKNPSMDYYENKLAVVFESADEDDSYIFLNLYDPASGVYTMFEVSEIEVEYFGNAKPVVAYTKREIMVIWKESSGSALKYRKLFKDDQGNWDWVSNEEDLPNTNSYSTNPTAAAIKSTSDYSSYIHIAWQHSSSSIKYMEYYRIKTDRNFLYYSTISSGSGFTGNKYPCISLYSDAYPGPYPIVSWTGSKKEYIANGSLAKTAGPGGYVWVYRTVVRPKASGWGSFYQTGSNVGYTNNNSTTNSSPYETIIAFSQSGGQTTKWIKRENSSYSVQTLSDNGIQTQVSNGGGLSEVKAIVFNKDDLPYICTPSNTDFSGGLSKASAHLPVTYGRVGVVVKNNIEFVYNIGDIQLDDENILFIERDDTLAVNNLKELNDAVRTENFVLNSNSKLQFSNIYYVVNSESADSLLDKNDAVTFKVELVNADNDRVAALFDQITYDKKNANKYENIDYQLDCAGIQNGTYYIRLVTAVKGKRDCFLSNVQNDISHLAKKNYEQVDLEEMIIPFKYELSQNYPNPFNPVTTIRYEMPEKGQVTLKVYDILKFRS